jgi:hypothetical protein
MHLVSDTGAVGAAAAWSHDVPDSQAPETTDAVWRTHSLRL